MERQNKGPSFGKLFNSLCRCISVCFHSFILFFLKLIPKSKNHTSSPLIYEGCSPGKYEFIGGYSEFVKLVRARHKLNMQNDIKEGGRECVGDVCKI